MKRTYTKQLFLWIFFLSWLSAQVSRAQSISTVVGNGTNSGGGDGGPATSASIKAIGVDVDVNGNIYIADYYNHRIRKINATTGIITMVAGIAGTVMSGFSGDGGLATAAMLKNPYDIAVAPNGDFYIADYGNNRIRKVNAITGIITTVAGTAMPVDLGDGGPAILAQIRNPAGIALDAAGNIYFSDYGNHRIRKIDTAGIITTIAGTGTGAYSGDGGAATAAQIKNPWGITVDAAGNIYFTDYANNRIRKITASTGIITTVAGTGTAGYTGNGGPATSARITQAAGIAVNGKGNIYFTDLSNHVIRKVNASDGIISTVAGTGTAGYNGDNGPATSVQFNSPYGLDADANGNIFVADFGNNRIRRMEGFINNSLALLEGATAAMNTTHLQFTDTSQPPSAITYTITSAITNGTLFKDVDGNRLAATGEKLALNSTFTQADIDAGIITFAHDGSETLSARFGFSASDGSKTIVGKIFTFTITAVNDYPVIADSSPGVSLTTNEDTDLPINGLQVSDAEAGTDKVLLKMTAGNGVFKIIDDIPGGVTNGEIIGNNSKNVTLEATMDAINITLAQNGVVYSPDLNFNGTNGVNFTLNDKGPLPLGGPRETLYTKNLIITPVNDAPVITSDGGGAVAALDRDEKATAVTEIKVTDVENHAITYSPVGGADQAKFSINSTTGALTFVTAPDFRVPTDADANNTYVVTVRATDDGPGTLFTEQTITVTIKDITPPVISSIVRKTPVEAVTKVSPVIYTVTFDEVVSGVDIADFMFTTTGTATGTVASVSAGNGTVVDVTVSGVAGDGALRLDVNASGTGITDPAGLGLSGGFTGGQAFTIDNTAPTVTGVENGKFYNTDRTISFTDATAATATLNGNPFTSGSTVTAEGAYTLVVTDAAANATTLRFTIDKTLPVITGVEDGKYYNTDRTIGFNKGTATLNGTPFTTGTTVTAEGAYTLVVTDVAANATSFRFTIDKTLPVVTGVENGKFFNTDRTISFNEGTATLNGAPFTSGNTVASQGAYTLVVIDASTNTITIGFTIDKTAPVVTGVENGKSYNTDRAISFTDATAATATLNGNPFTSGSTVAAEGVYTLVVTDAANNATTVAFTVDKTAPTGTLVIRDGAAYTNNIEVMLALTTQDGMGSQTAELRFSNDNSTWTGWEAYATSRAYTLPAGDGPKTVYLQLRDAVGNVSALISDDINLDRTLPAVVVTSLGDDSVNTAFTVQFNFQEAVTGFVPADIHVTNGAASGFTAVNPKTYTISIIPAVDGLVKVQVPANMAVDAAGNANTVSNELIRVYDGTKPTVAITGPVAGQVNAAFTATFTFSEPVTGFTSGDISVSNGAASGFTAQSASVYTATITPAADGLVKVDVAANVAADPASNGNLASNELTKTYDATSPTVLMATTAADATNVNPVPVSVTFSEEVTDFVLADVRVTGGTPGGFSGSGKHYSFTITPAGNGTITVSLAAGAAHDAAANGNLASNTVSRLYDATKPTVTVSAPAANPISASFVATFTISEEVNDFTVADIAVSPASARAANFVKVSDKVYTATITPTVDGVVTVKVEAGTAFDAATNGNDASNTISRSYDATKPRVVITAPPVASFRAAFTATFTFSEPVAGFTSGDISVSNGAASGFTAQSASVYTATITPAFYGVPTVAVAANAAADAAANGNEAATPFTRIYDGTSPTVVVATTVANPTNVNPIPVSITFSEDVMNFVPADIAVTNGVVKGLTAVNAKTYQALISPSADGLVSVQVAANLALDAAGNGNKVSNTLTSTYDGTSPTVAIKAPASGPFRTAFTATFTISEPVSGFVAGDITVSNGAVSNFKTQSASVYTATITPAVRGLLTVAVAANVAADAAVNGNKAATSLVVEDGCTNLNASIIIRRNGEEMACAYKHCTDKGCNHSRCEDRHCRDKHEGHWHSGYDDDDDDNAHCSHKDHKNQSYHNGYKGYCGYQDHHDGYHKKSCGDNTDNDAAGLDEKTIYLGYGEQSVILDATSGNDYGTTYAWTGNGVLSSKTSGTPEFAPKVPGVYTFTVVETNRTGCAASTSVTITVVDVRCGSKNDKVSVCHQGQVICVMAEAVKSHLAHGDKIGACASPAGANARFAMESQQVQEPGLKVYPNPAHEKTKIGFTMVEEGSYRLAIYDLKGALVKNVAAGKAESDQVFSYDLDATAYPVGVYLIRLTTDGEVVTKRLVIEK